jgi:hypothetical protein
MLDLIVSIGSAAEAMFWIWQAPEAAQIKSYFDRESMTYGG